MTIDAIMALWNEEDCLYRAIESTKDFVDKYIVFNNSTDQTEEVLRDCMLQYGLKYELYNNTLSGDLLDPDKKRAFARTKSTADWSFSLDGDMVFHTDGPCGFDKIIPLLEKADKRVVFWSGCVYLYADKEDSYLPDIPSNPHAPFITPHPLFFGGGITHQRHLLGLGLGDGTYIQDLPFQPVFWNWAEKSPLRLFMRTRLGEWLDSPLFEKYKTLDGFVMNEIPDYKERALEWWSKVRENRCKPEKIIVTGCQQLKKIKQENPKTSLDQIYTYCPALLRSRFG